MMWQRPLGRRRKGDAAVGNDTCRQRFRRRSFFEALEERTVLATLVLDAGTAGEDTINISDNGGNLLVTRNGTQIHNGPVSGYDAVQINADDGADTINLNSLPIMSEGVEEAFEASLPLDGEAFSRILPTMWSLTPDANINDSSGSPINLPHITVNGTFDGTPDVYRFHVTVGENETVNGFFDIDGVDQTKFDAFLELLDANGNPILFAFGDDAPVDPGSAAYDEFGITFDPLFGFVFPEGSHDYYIRVSQSPFAEEPFEGTPSYQLQLVVANYPTGGSPPGIVINGGGGSDTLNVAAGLMPLSAVDPNVVEIGPAPFAGTLRHGADEVAQYQGVENFHGGAAFTVLTDLAGLGLQDGNPDTTFVRPDAGGTTLLVDVNGVPYFGGGINQILLIAVNGSSDADTITVQNTVIGAHVDGGDGNDTITTAAGPDIVYGGNGDDVISTDGGNDYVAGGAGNDTISGGDGDDSLHGNAGDDFLAGQQGHDVVSGGAGNDQVAGHQGQDVLIGGSGLDQVLGNSDRDLLFASGVVVWEGGSPISLGESDSSQFGDDNYFRLQDLREDWLAVVDLTLLFQDFADKYDSGSDDGLEDKLQGGNGDDVFFTDGTAKIVDSAFDRETTS